MRPSLSTSICRPPFAIWPSRFCGTRYSTTLPVLGSSFPKYWELKSEYHTLPCASNTSSWGDASGRGRSYVVYITWVALPLGRGNGFNGNSNVSAALRLIELRYLPRATCPAVGG